MIIDSADLRKISEITLRPQGVLRLHGTRMVWVPSDGLPQSFDLRPHLRSRVCVDYLADEARGIAVIVPEDSQDVCMFRVSDRSFTRVAQVDRVYPAEENWPNGLDSLKFVVTENEILVVFEQDMVCLERNGEFRWGARRPSVTYGFSRFAPGVAIFESDDFCPLGYSLVDGACAPCEN